MLCSCELAWARAAIPVCANTDCVEKSRMVDGMSAAMMLFSAAVRFCTCVVITAEASFSRLIDRTHRAAVVRHRLNGRVDGRQGRARWCQSVPEMAVPFEPQAVVEKRAHRRGNRAARIGVRQEDGGGAAENTDVPL